jgi:dihydrofolate reductase
MSITLYIATSIDGYIATPEGGVDWLMSVEQEGEDYGYGAFYESVDGLLIGRSTYDQILTFGDWPYPGKPAYVFTHRPAEIERDDVFFVKGDPGPVVARLQAQGHRRLWLVGGAGLTHHFFQQGLIDEIILSVIPVILGDGIPLFRAGLPTQAYTLLSSQSYPSGLVSLHYVQKN